jgi:AmmeMemoRadiSam system protein A
MKQKIFFYIIIVFLSLLICLDSAAVDMGNKYRAEEKEYLLNLARQTLDCYLKNGTIPKVNVEGLTEGLKQERVCFLTLTKKGYGLRGCMGLFKSRAPLYENVIDRAIAAATKDPRFPPVSYDELKDIKIEISILTAPEELRFNSAQELLSKLKPAKHGVIIYTPYGSSTYLPQVWEQLPDKRLFLSYLCRKHGAPPDYWKTNYKNIRVQVYYAIVFSEETYGGNGN